MKLFEIRRNRKAYCFYAEKKKFPYWDLSMQRFDLYRGKAHLYVHEFYALWILKKRIINLNQSWL